jgi:hypothetical protein
VRAKPLRRSLDFICSGRDLLDHDKRGSLKASESSHDVPDRPNSSGDEL